MRKAHRWDCEKRTYTPIELPDRCAMYCVEMDTVISCAQCGKELEYGQSYTSMEIHTDLGMGYGVCEDCYEGELRRRKEAARKWRA